MKAWLASIVLATALAGPACAQTPAPPATVSLASVRQDMIGTWQNVADTRFMRELDANGRAFDRILGEEGDSVPGSWTVFAGSAPPQKLARQKFDPSGVYLEIDRDEDVLLFQLVRVSRSDMQMVDLEQKVILTFTRLD
jgi:hypothetical protein